MTRLNVYAGPAGFWLVRGGAYDSVDDGTTPALNDGILPGPAPVAGQGVVALNNPADPIRQSIREIPVVIQDRSFNGDGSLYYPDNRAFFEGLNVAPAPPATPPVLDIPFVPGSDIAPIWNPEAFFHTMVVNGVTWPSLEVAPAIYRLRLLNGCNSRFLNLALFRVNKQGKLNKEFPIIQIGAEQGFLPQAVEIRTGKATLLPGDGLMPMDPTKGTFKDQAVLMGLAERADVLVDFRGLKNGTVIQMTNTAPDAPFGGFPDIPADPATTGQVMQFVVNSALLGQSPTDPVLADGVTPNPNAATNPYSVIPNAEPASTAVIAATQNLSLNEEESLTLCVDVDLAGNVIEVPGQTPPCIPPAAPMAPKAALLGTFDPITGATTPMTWAQPMTERPIQGTTELWEVYNLTVDGHPIHLHLVRFEVVDRQALDPITMLPVPGTIRPPEPWETGYKDTVISYPGEVTRLKATFDIAGLYVWHCHIVEHEDNEMMRPYCVDAAVGVDSCPLVP
jgi:FtsP/CotA-like multicopper oxidase with cupredoxin domain